MSTHLTCKITECNKPSRKRGWCYMHHCRWLRHGDPTYINGTPPGSTLAFVNSILNTTRTDCIAWPFSRDGGYGQMGYQGKRCWAHRVVCELAHGNPTSERPQVAHSCGNGSVGCVNPRHLRWASSVENHQDMVSHGRSTRGERNPMARLTPHQVLEIRKRSALGETVRKIAEDFPVTVPGVHAVVAGRVWGWLTQPAQTYL